MYTRDELNLVGTCIDLAIKAGGAGAAKTLLPLFEKTEQIAREMDDADKRNEENTHYDREIA